MRSDRLYLVDIVEAGEAVGRFLQTSDFKTFQQDELLQSAVLLKLLMFGEAAARVSAALRGRYAGIPWTHIIAFRNFAIHAYFAAD